MNLINKSRIIFILSISGILQFIFLSIISMIFYPGGSFANPNQNGYAFWENFLSDLGRVVAYNGSINTISYFLFNGSLIALGILEIPFWIDLRHFWADQKLISDIIMIIGLISNCGIMLIAFFPLDINGLGHGAAVDIWLIPLLMINILYIRLIIKNSPKFQIWHLIFTLLSCAGIIAILLGIFIEVITGTPLLVLPTIQKIGIYAILVWFLMESVFQFKEKKYYH